MERWVVDMEKMQEQANPSYEMVRWKLRSIYRVPEVVTKKVAGSDAFRPEFVSLGPLHHGEPHLLPMEEHKGRAVLHFVKRAGKPLVHFVAAIQEVADELEAAYADLDDKWRGSNRGSFVQVMVTDGCFLLELIRIYRIFVGEEIGYIDYAENDPVFSAHGFLSVWSFWENDMIAMENQLPLVVLQKLLTVRGGTSPSAKDINNMVLALLGHTPQDENNLGLHFLDLCYKSYCADCPDWEAPAGEHERRTPSAVELSEAGVQFKKSSTTSIHDIDFEDGVLSMPVFLFHENKDRMLMNLMAFEWLHPGAKKKMRNYITFLDNIIKSERDVALLISEGLLDDMIFNDKRMLQMFKTLGYLGSTNHNNRLSHVQWKMNDYCSKRWNKWRSSFVKTYLKTPWVFISLIAAVILLIATLLQTVYTIVSVYTKNG